MEWKSLLVIRRGKYCWIDRLSSFYNKIAFWREDPRGNFSLLRTLLTFL